MMRDTRFKKYMVFSFSLFLAGCAALAPGMRAENIVAISLENEPNVSVDSLVVWQTETGFILTGKLFQFGSSVRERGHIHVAAKSDLGAAPMTWAAFPTRGSRLSTSRKISRFSVELEGLSSHQSTILFQYHGGAHS